MNYQDLRDADLDRRATKRPWRVFVEGELVLETRDEGEAWRRVQRDNGVMTDGKVRKWA